MELSVVRTCYHAGLIDNFVFHSYFCGFTMSFMAKGNLRTLTLARGGQKVYKNFDALLSDYKSITGKDTLELIVKD